MTSRLIDMPTFELTGSLMSVEDIRARFPALSRIEHGAPVAYFDGPGGTQVPMEVVEAVQEYLLGHNANTFWGYTTSRETDAILGGAREAFADFVGGRPSEIVFGANMTSLTFHLGRALGRRLQPGDRIVVTELDHHANIAPWQALVVERGVELRSVRIDPATGTLDDADLDTALSEAPVSLLAISGASNALGTIPDVARAAALAHDAGALVFVDGVHLAAHSLVDVAALGADFLCCSPYKFYGPHIGVLWGREQLLAELPVPKLEPATDAVPHRFETGTLNHEGIAGAAAAVDFIASLAPGETRRNRLANAFAGMHERGELLLRRLWDGLSAVPAVHLHGPPPGAPRTPTLAFTVEGFTPQAVTQALDRRAVFVSHGDFYARTVIQRLGRAPEGVVRAGCAAYTTAEEVDRLIEGVTALV
jgi:cysteine desulfurase family protein (TIGR01976 family)